MTEATRDASVPEKRPYRDGPKQHELKVAGAHLMDALLDGTKTFEVRLNDRDFRAGDTLWLREWVPHGFTGRHLKKRVLYIFGPDDDLCGFLLADNVIVMALGAVSTYRADPGVSTRPKWSAHVESLGFTPHCVYCGNAAEGWDHVIPVARGGLDTMDNLVSACAWCNSQKGVKTGAEFIAWREGRARAMSLPCPTCGADGDETCRGKAGGTKLTPCLERRQLPGCA